MRGETTWLATGWLYCNTVLKLQASITFFFATHRTYRTSATHVFKLIIIHNINFYNNNYTKLKKWLLLEKNLQSRNPAEHVLIFRLGQSCKGKRKIRMYVLMQQYLSGYFAYGVKCVLYWSELTEISPHNDSLH